MRRRSRLKALAMATLLAAGGAYAIASWDWCGPTPPAALFPLSTRAALADTLLAGAAAVELSPPWPVEIAGYGPPRPTATAWHHPLKARAVVLKANSLVVAVVSIDALMVPADVVAEVREKSHLPDAWVVATHTHSSFGAYDQRLLAQLAGTGAFRPSARDALVNGAVAALEKAAQTLAPARLELGTLDDAGLTGSRSGGPADLRLTRLKVMAGDQPLAQLVLLAAHPTLMPRKPGALDPDYPGALSSAREEAAEGVTLVLQTAAGNAATFQTDGETAQAFGARAGLVATSVPTVPLELSRGLALARVRFATSAPDASRLVPKAFAHPGKNFLCASADREAEVSALRLGPLVLLAMPLEPSYGAGLTFEALSQLPLRVVGLANGYLGYLETAELVDQGSGEARRQYYDRALLERAQGAATMALQSVGARAR